MKKLILLFLFISNPVWAAELKIPPCFTDCAFVSVSSSTIDTGKVSATTATLGNISTTGNIYTGGLNPFTVYANITSSTDEVAYKLDYTEDKSAGNGTGLVVNQTDTSSPGTSLIADFQSGGLSKWTLRNDGLIVGGYTTGTIIQASSSMISPTLGTGGANTLLIQNTGAYSAADVGVDMLNGSLATNSAGEFTGVQIRSQINQSGTAGFNSLFVNNTTISTGSGVANLFRIANNNIDKLTVDTEGVVSTKNIAFNSITTLTSSGDAPIPYHHFHCDATAGDVTFNLHSSANGPKGLVHNFLKIDGSANDCILDGAGGETFSGSTTITISTQWENITIYTDQSNWFIE